MLARDDISAVSITTPNFLHAQAAIDALNAGKHVLCEKPLAMNAKEGAKMVAAAQKNGKKLMCGYNHRFRPEVQTLKKFAEDSTERCSTSRLDTCRRTFPAVLWISRPSSIRL
jgi:predicted dehydrogenase